MRVLVDYRFTSEPFGGGNQFLAALAGALPAMGVTLTAHGEPTDVLLINSASSGPDLRLSPETVRKMKRRYSRKRSPSWLNAVVPGNRPAVVHRFMGLSRLYGRRDDLDDLQIAINRHAHYSIIQSQFCVECLKSAGVLPEHYAVILNGTNGSVFSRRRSADPHEPLRIVGSSWSGNPLKGASLLLQLAQGRALDVRFAGRWPDDLRKGNVKTLGILGQGELADVLADCDVFFHGAKNDPCSNALTEALAVGLPAIYLDSGGNGEICRGTRFGEAMAEGEDPREALRRLMKRYDQVAADLCASRDLFLIETAARRYVTAFETALTLVQGAG